MDAKTKKRGLGRGLSALISSTDPAQPEINTSFDGGAETEIGTAGVQMIDIYRVEPDRNQPRQNFEDTALEELTASIAQYGVLKPLLVQKKDDYYQIIAGERRWRAAKNAGVSEVPVIVKEYSSEEVLEISLIENIQREDLSPLEEAKAYQRLIDEHHLKQEDVAKRVGKSRSTITNSLRLLNLADEVQELVEEGSLSTGHAKVLLSVGTKEEQVKLAKQVVAEDLSVRQLEQLLARKKAEKPGKPPKAESEAEALAYEAISQKMQDALGTKVTIVRGKRKGKIEIEYYSPEDLERILGIMDRKN